MEGMQKIKIILRKEGRRKKIKGALRKKRYRKGRENRTGLQRWR